MMRADTRDADEWNQRQKWPPGDSAAHGWNLAAVADGAIDAVLLENLNIALGLLRSHFGPGG
jgi:hypothetical protein